MEHEEVLFCSLGMFIIDKIIYEDGHTIDDVIGGAGTYAAVGARVFAQANQIGLIVDYGHDISPAIKEQLASYQFNLVSREDAARSCTRGLNVYHGDHRAFEYLTPKIRLNPADLTAPLLHSQSFHLICSPLRCIKIGEELISRRAQERCAAQFVTVWEPVPDSCVVENRDALFKAMRGVTVISPNESEARNVLGASESVTVEDMAEELFSHGAKSVIIRCGAQGAYLRSTEQQGWSFSAVTSTKALIDATGAGNAFCGAVAVSLAQNLSIAEAISRGHISASLAVMQVGLPKLTLAAGKQLWNASTNEQLLTAYKSQKKDEN